MHAITVNMCSIQCSLTNLQLFFVGKNSPFAFTLRLNCLIYVLSSPPCTSPSGKFEFCRYIGEINEYAELEMVMLTFAGSSPAAANDAASDTAETTPGTVPADISALKGGTHEAYAEDY